MRMTCPRNVLTSGKYSPSGSQMMMSSSVRRMTLQISRLAAKDLPEPGVPKIRPLGFFSFFRSTMIRLWERAFNPQYRASPPVWKSSCEVKGTKMAVELVVRPRWMRTRLWPSGRHDTMPFSCWKSSGISWQLCCCARLCACLTLSASCFLSSAVFITRKVMRNMRSLRLCRSSSSFLASPP